MNFRRILTPLAAVAVLGLALPALAGPGHDHGHGHGHAATATVGQPAPTFTLVDHAGKTHDVADYAGKVVVLEWTNPQCPFVQRHYRDGNTTMIDLQKAFGAEVVWLAVDSSHFVTAESASAWAKEKKIPYPILLDASGEVGRAYAAKTTPHMFVIDPAGTLVYDGAIDDDAAGKSEKPTNYVAAAVKAARKGEAVATATTKPYGCSVKYSQAGEKAAKASR